MTKNLDHLAEATSRYFEQMGPNAAAEEKALSQAMAQGASTIDFDKEP